MASRTMPFSRFEFLIAWRYLRARRAEGGVSVMTWISLIGIALGVMALVATLAVRAGFRAEFVDTILGANAHVTVYRAAHVNAEGVSTRAVEDYAGLAERWDVNLVAQTRWNKGRGQGLPFYDARAGAIVQGKTVIALPEPLRGEFVQPRVVRWPGQPDAGFLLVNVGPLLHDLRRAGPDLQVAIRG